MNYKIGQSKKEAEAKIGKQNIDNNKEFRPPNSPDVSCFGLEDSVKPFQNYHYISIWAAKLLQNAKKLDDELDIQHNKVIELPDSSFSSKKKLKASLKDLKYNKESLRCLEVDIEEFLHVASITEYHDASDSKLLKLSNISYHLLNQVNSTYKCVYDLIVFKLNSISRSRVTVTNILISIIAVTISAIALYSSLNIQ